MSHYFIECTIEKNRVPYAGIQWEPWTFQCVSVGCGWCSRGSWCSDQQTLQHTWPLVTMQACFCHRIKKVKTVIVTFLSHNSDLYWNCEFTSYNSDFIRIVRYCKFTIARKKSEFWDKVTITLYPLYSMAEISFHKFHMCKGKKQTNINLHSLTHILTPFSYLFSLFLIQLLLSLLQLFLSLSPRHHFVLFLILCVVLHPQNQFKEVFFTLCCWCNGKSFNTWLFLQLSLESAISKYFSDLLLKSAYQLLQYFI